MTLCKLLARLYPKPSRWTCPDFNCHYEGKKLLKGRRLNSYLLSDIIKSHSSDSTLMTRLSFFNVGTWSLHLVRLYPQIAWRTVGAVAVGKAPHHTECYFLNTRQAQVRSNRIGIQPAFLNHSRPGPIFPTLSQPKRKISLSIQLPVARPRAFGFRILFFLLKKKKKRKPITDKENNWIDPVKVA